MLGSWENVMKAIPRGGVMCNADHLLCMAKKCENMGGMKQEDHDACAFKLMAEELKCQLGAKMGRRFL